MLLRRFCSRVRFRNQRCNCGKKLWRIHPFDENHVNMLGTGRRLLQSRVQNDRDFGLEPLHLRGDLPPGTTGKQLVCDDQVHMIEGKDSQSRFTVGCG